MEGKRLNFNKPLLSVRRFHSSISSSATGAAEKVEKNAFPEPNVPVKKASLPFYRSDLKSGPVRDPGVVSFVWEQVPGLPKEDSPNSGVLTSTDFTDADRHLEVPKFPAGPRSDAVLATVSSTGERLDGDRSTVPKENEPSEKPVVVEDSVSDRRGEGCDADFDDEEDSFSDAVETLSRTESCSMNCSASGMTGMGDLTASVANEPSGSFFSTDPQVRDFMMGRFLPAAQAMASGSPKVYLRKPNSSSLEPTRRVQDGASRRRVPLPYQNRPKTISRFPDSGQTEIISDDDEDDDGYYDDTRHMAMKGCGFLLPKFCLRSSLGLMNPVTGVKAKTRAAALPHRRSYHPAIKTSEDQGRPVVYVRDVTWEAVFRHKLGDGIQKGENGSTPKQTTESYPVTYWSNSQSPNGSSSFLQSTGGGASPDRNDLSQSSFRQGKGLLGVPAGDRKIGKVVFESPRKGIDRNPLSNKSWSGSGSPVIEKTLYVDSACMPETPNSKSSSGKSNVFLNPKSRDCEVATESEFASEDEKLRNESPEVLRTDIPCATHGSDHRENSGNHLGESREDASMDSSTNAQVGDQGKDGKFIFQSLLPPPLPTSPSESWLRRTLPSVSSKNPTTQTFLGMQFNSKMKTVQISADPFLKNVMQSSQIRFSEVLAKPLNEDH